MRQAKRLPAGALMLVIAVSVMVAAILLALLMLTNNRRLLVQRDTMHQALRRNLSSGLAYVQGHPALPYFQPQSLDLFNEGTDSVEVEKRVWGVFDIAVVRARKGHLADTTVALLGSQFTVLNKAALYLADENVPLSINGDAQVRGAIFLSKAEPVRTARLPFVSAARTGPAVTGAIQASQLNWPIVNDTALARLRAYSTLQLTAWLPAGTQTTNLLQSKTVSFTGPATVLYQAEPIDLKGLTVTGQVVIASARRLVVEASNTLDNVLLMAPVVVVKAGFCGRVQIVARDSAIIEPRCQFLYPSAICTFAAAQSTQVLLGEESRVSGVIIAAQSVSSAYPCAVVMRSGATVEGQVYSAGFIENCGAVNGTVMCRRLVYRTRATFFNNYLVNATLNRQALPPAFLTTPLLNAGASTGVVAWLR